MTLPHICFVAANIYPVLSGAGNVEFAGGGEVQQTIVLRALASRGYRVSVITRDFGQDAIVDCDGITVYRLPPVVRRGVKGLRFIHPRLTDMVAVLRKVDPDLVYQRIAGAYTLASGWYARWHGKPFVYAAGSDRDFELGVNPSIGKLDIILYRFGLSRFANLVFVQNEAQRSLLRDNFGKTGELVPNCFEEKAAGNGAPSGPVLWVGTIKPIKRPEIFLELARRHSSKRFRMVGGAGDIPDASAYLQRIRSAATELPNLEFCGHVPFREVGRCFDDCSVLVNSSSFEGFPNTFLQAWIRGIPSVSFVRPETAPGQCGTLACWDVDEMAARLQNLTSNPEFWTNASDASRAYFIKHHSVDAVIHRYEELFRRALAART